MAITRSQVEGLCAFAEQAKKAVEGYDETDEISVYVDERWLMEHVTLKFDDATSTIQIEIGDMDLCDYERLKTS